MNPTKQIYFYQTDSKEKTPEKIAAKLKARENLCKKPSFSGECFFDEGDGGDSPTSAVHDF